MAQTEPLLTAAEVADKLHMGKRTVQRLAQSGDLPYVRKLEGPNGSYLFDPGVIDYVAKQKVEASR